MDWKQFFSALVSALAWPSAIVVIVCLVRKPLLDLLPKVRTFKYGGVEVDFGAELKAAKEQVSKEAPEAPILPPSPDIYSEAATSPHELVLKSWHKIDEQLFRVADKYQLNLPEVNVSVGIMDALLERGLVSNLVHSTFLRLRPLHASAAHMRPIEVSDAVLMASMCVWLVNFLERL